MRRQSPERPSGALSAGRAGSVVLLGAVGALAGLAVRAAGRYRDQRPSIVTAQTSGSPSGSLHAAAAVLNLAVLADSAIEHARGSFRNPGMYTPLIVSAAGLACSVEGARRKRLPVSVGNGVNGLAVAVGGIGAGFHVYNLLRKPGGLSWQNAFYAAPVGAPAALSLAGAIGLTADRISREGPARRLIGLPVGRLLAALTSLGLAGSAGEAGLLHFRGSFQNPFMWLPVAVPPVAAILMGKAAVEPARERHRPLTRGWLALTAAVGLAGVGFHAFGISRAMGGWRNWSQNLFDGPPLPAPPSFTALAIAALAALVIRDSEDRT